MVRPSWKIINKLQVTTNRGVYKYKISHINKILYIYRYENIQVWYKTLNWQMVGKSIKFGRFRQRYSLSTIGHFQCFMLSALYFCTTTYITFCCYRNDVSLYTSLCNYVTLLDNDPRGSENIGETVDNHFFPK
jgi:hypothetical protein